MENLGKKNDVYGLILVALDCVLLSINLFKNNCQRLNCKENPCVLCIKNKQRLKNCLLFCHNSDVHLLSQMVYVSKNDFVNICIPGNSWKRLVNQLSINGVRSSCITHNQKTIRKHTNVMQKVFINNGSFSFSQKTQNIGLQNVHFGIGSLFCDVGSMFHTKSFTDKYYPRTSKSM